MPQIACKYGNNNDIEYYLSERISQECFKLLLLYFIVQLCFVYYLKIFIENTHLGLFKTMMKQKLLTAK